MGWDGGGDSNGACVEMGWRWRKQWGLSRDGDGDGGQWMYPKVLERSSGMIEGNGGGPCVLERDRDLLRCHQYVGTGIISNTEAQGAEKHTRCVEMQFLTGNLVHTRHDWSLLRHMALVIDIGDGDSDGDGDGDGDGDCDGDGDGDEDSDDNVAYSSIILII